MRGWNSAAWNRIRYSLYAPVYDIPTSFRKGRGRAVALLRPQEGDRVLIVGAGTGRDLEHLPPFVTVVAGDIAAGMLWKLRKRAAAAAMPVEVRKFDAQRLDFADASFDLVLLHLIVAVVPDPRKCLEEAARVVRPGGRISVLDKFAPDDRTIPPWRRFLNPVVETVATSITRQLAPLLSGLPLRLIVREPAAWGRMFEVALLERVSES